MTVRRFVMPANLLLAITSLAIASLAAPTKAPGLERQASDISASLRQWMKSHQVPSASVAIMQGDRLVSAAGFGGMAPTAPTRIASLSKAITAVCVAQLVDAGRLSFTTPLGTALARTFARLGQPIDPRFKTITIEQLLAHRGGLAREPVTGPRDRTLADRFIKALATPLIDEPGASRTYSNVGYLVLGMVVEAVTGTDYENYCRLASLTPMKVSGTIDPQLRARAPSGGWRVSAVNYARFIQVFEPSSAALGPLARAWQETQRGYGLGIGIARTAHGTILTHTGRVALRERGGGYIVKYPDGWTAVVTFAGDVRRPGISDLRQLLRRAIADL
jgi:CubicO group peptidase (beta-lactamase class C family)